jgi:dehydrogenase/reductase SDR family protein 12
MVHNAGALLQSRQRSPQGHELTFAVHVLGPFLLSHRLAPLLGEARDGRGRVVFVSSGGAYTARLDLGDLQLERREFDGPEFYAHAKRAQIALLPELNRHLGPNVRVDAMHPGWAKTPGVADSLPRFNRALGPLLRTPEQGADTIVWLAARGPSPIDEGRLWMDRRPRPEHRVPWTAEEPGEGARLYEACAELTGLDAETPWDPSHRDPAGAVHTHPSP